MKLLIFCLAAVVVWMIVSQLIAWMIAGDDPDGALDMWSAVFLLAPMGIGYGLVYVLTLVLRELDYWLVVLRYGHAERKPITADDIVL